MAEKETAVTHTDEVDDFVDIFRELTDLSEWAYLEQQLRARGFHREFASAAAIGKAFAQIRVGLTQLRNAIEAVEVRQQDAARKRDIDAVQNDTMSGIARSLING